MRIPGPKWGAGRPPLETPKSRCATRIGRTPRRFAAGASVPLGKAASACALAPAAAPPPLRFGGLRPLAPCVPRWGTFARHARLPPAFPVGERLPIMRASAWDHVRNGFCGNAFANLSGSSCREAARSSVTPLARLCRRHSSATASGGIPKGAQPSLASLCLLSAGQKVGARRGLSASKGKIKNYENVKKIKNPFPSNQKEKGVKGGALAPQKQESTPYGVLSCVVRQNLLYFAVERSIVPTGWLPLSFIPERRG